MTRGRRKDKIKSVRFSLGEGNIKLGVDSKLDELYKKIKALPDRMRFRIVVRWLIEGSNLESPATANDLNEIRQATKEITELRQELKNSVVSLKLRWEIFTRDKFRCVVCGRNAVDGARLQVDHIFPRSKGGLADKSNLATLCSDCNKGKSDSVPVSDYMELIRAGER